MTVAVIGDCPSGQPPQELRVFNDDRHVATFLNSAIATFEVNGKSSQICYLQLELTVDKNPRCIKQDARVEFLLTIDGGPLTVVFVGRVDGIRTRTTRGGPTSIEFRARGLAAPLVDQGFRGEVGPTVDAVIDALVAPAGLKTRTDYADQPLSAWINVESTLAAIRLLGVNLGAIVKTPGEHLELVSYAVFRERLFGKPQFAISGDEIRSVMCDRGLAFRGRSGTMTEEQPNVPLELTIPDAAQSVLGPLCLLSGLAAQWHVGLISLSPTAREILL